MAKRNIFVCDACEKSIPFVGPVLVLQNNNRAIEEKVWDLCEECEDKIIRFIESLGENNGSI